MKRLLLAMLLASCHPAPVSAHEADLFLPVAIVDEMNADAEMVCDAANQTDSDICLDMVFDSYLKAVEMGAQASEKPTLVEVLKLAEVETGCVLKTSQSCKVYTPLWGSYYLTGEANKEVLNGKTTSKEVQP
ncbi:hypothetical protein pSalSNUABM01_150 [Salmonella phage pSal-SNUABM-01]|nr:hypothetical protein pSalSNUABM01_150 [Salmonella phage pSal-SNUABM-01]